MEEKYFIITSGESGISIKTCETSEELKEFIQRDEDGCYYFGKEPVFLGEIPEIDDGYFMSQDGSMIIIKGKIITPIPKRIVEEYEIE